MEGADAVAVFLVCVFVHMAADCNPAWVFFFFFKGTICKNVAKIVAAVKFKTQQRVVPPPLPTRLQVARQRRANLRSAHSVSLKAE